MRKNKQILFSLILPVLLFSSCLTASADLTILEDGRGELRLDYRISKLVSGIQKDSLAGSRLFPLPVSEREFQQRSSPLQGLTVQQVSVREDMDYTYIQSELTFDSIRDLSRFLRISVFSEQTDNLNRLTIGLFEQDQPMDQETRNIISELFKDDLLRISISVPGTVSSSSTGSLKENRQGVDFTEKLENLYGRESFSWWVEWQ